MAALVGSVNIIYSCPCLNVKIHLNNKYSSKNHETDRAEFRVYEGEGALKGWKFDLGIGGIVMEQPMLTKSHTLNALNWIIIECLNCSTKVYALHNPESPSDSNNRAMDYMHPLEGSIVVLDGAVYGAEIEDIKKRDGYSEVFRIILYPEPKSNHQVSTPTSPSFNNDLYFTNQLLPKVEAYVTQQRQLTESRIATYKSAQLAELQQKQQRATEDKENLLRTLRRLSPAPRSPSLSDQREPLDNNSRHIQSVPLSQSPAQGNRSPLQSGVSNNAKRKSLVFDEATMTSYTKKEDTNNPKGVANMQVDKGKSREIDRRESIGHIEEEENMFNLDEDISQGSEEISPVSPTVSAPAVSFDNRSSAHAAPIESDRPISPTRISERPIINAVLEQLADRDDQGSRDNRYDLQPAKPSPNDRKKKIVRKYISEEPEEDEDENVDVENDVTNSTPPSAVSSVAASLPIHILRPYLPSQQSNTPPKRTSDTSNINNPPTERFTISASVPAYRGYQDYLLSQSLVAQDLALKSDASGKDSMEDGRKLPPHEWYARTFSEDYERPRSDAFVRSLRGND